MDKMREYVLDLDKRRVLKYAFLGLRKIRLKYGSISFEKILATLEQQIDEIPFIVWAGLVWEDTELTEERVVELLDATIGKKYSIVEICDIAMGALALHFGGSKKVKASAIAIAKMRMKEVKEKTETGKKKEVTPVIPSSKTQKK